MSENENPSVSSEQSSDAILQCLTQYILKDLLTGSDTNELDPEEDLLGSGLIDSLGIMRLVAFIEKEYSLAVPPEDVRIEHFMNLESLTSYVGELLAEKN